MESLKFSTGRTDDTTNFITPQGAVKPRSVDKSRCPMLFVDLHPLASSRVKPLTFARRQTIVVQSPKRGFLTEKPMKHIQNAVLTAVLVPILGMAAPPETPVPEAQEDPSSMQESLVTTQANALLPISSPLSPPRVAQTMQATITAYSSTPDQTWGDPFITASGKRVRDGIVAANMLPLGAKIQIPGLFGDKILVVEDRMHPRNYGKVDIWFPSREEAKTFGVKRTTIVVLED